MSIPSQAPTGPSVPASRDPHRIEPLIVYACFTEKTGASEQEIEKVIPAHKAWAAEREAAGDIFIAGPFLTEDLGYAGEGLIAFRASSLAVAESLAATDPMHASGVRRFRIRPWRLNEGLIHFTIAMSQRGFGIG